MSILQFLTSGGMATIGGDLSEDHRNIANETIKNFANKVKSYGMQLQV